MSDNIKVAVRVRPLNKNEIAESSQNIIKITPPTLSISDPVSKKNKDFGFDYIFDTKSLNSEVYKSIGEDIVTNALIGYNCCILAYGQTGSGKTYTMLNYDKNNDKNASNNDKNADASNENGLIPQIANALINISNNLPSNKEIKMEVSFIEIYAEKIYDLLNARDEKTSNGNNLKLHINPKIGTYIENLSIVPILNINDVMKLIEKGFSQRSTTATAMNEQSSRSHAIFTITFNQTTYSSTGADRKILNTKTSKINLVDLAGSERVKTSKVSGVGFQEAISINKSLSMLSTVFNELIESNTMTKIRSSVLTSLLADSIGGNSKTVIIANISPSSIQYDITLQTLLYVYRTKKIAVYAKVNETVNAVDVAIVNELKSEIERLRAELKNSSDAETMRKLKKEILEYEKLYEDAKMSWNDKLTEKNNQLTETNETNDKLNMEITKLSVALSDLLTDNEKLMDINKSNTDDLNKLIKTNDDLNKNNDSLNKTIDDLNKTNEINIKSTQRVKDKIKKITSMFL